MRLVHRCDRRRRRGREPAIVVGCDRHAAGCLDQEGGMAEIGYRHLGDRRLSLGGSSRSEAGEGRLGYSLCNRLALAGVAWRLLRMRDRRPERMNEPYGGERVDKVPEHQPSPLSLCLTSGLRAAWSEAVEQRMEAFAFARPDDGVTGGERIVQAFGLVQLQTAGSAHVFVTAPNCEPGNGPCSTANAPALLPGHRHFLGAFATPPDGWRALSPQPVCAAGTT